MISVEREPDGSARGAVVMIHGRGASEHDLVGLADELDPEALFHWYFPRGPFGLPPGGAHWYAVEQVGHPDPVTFAQGYAELSAFVDELPHAQTVVGGFSQGAVMAYAVGLGRGRPRPAGVIALSGFIPEVEGWELGTEQPFPPIAIGHGTLDPVIPVQFFRRAVATLEEAGATGLLCRASPVGHVVDPAFLIRLRPWLKSALPEPGE